jgi:hypothetical protein
MEQANGAIRTRMSELSKGGYWWIPEADSDADRLGGTLEFSKEDGGELRLLGTFADLKSFFPSVDAQYSIVHGSTTDGKDITLVDCMETHSQFGSAGVPKQTLSPRFVVVGHHLDDFNDLLFQRASIRFSNLEDWLERTGIETVSPSPRGESYRQSYVRPTAPAIRIPGGTLRFSFGWSARETRFRSAAMEEHSALHVSLAKGFNVSELLRRFVSPMQNLLTICTLEPSDVVELKLELGKSKEHRIWLDVYYQSVVEAPRREKPLLRFDMLVSAKELGRNLPPVLRNWLTSSEELSSVMSLYFAVMSGRWMFLESRFLNLAQAAEVLHRLTYPNRILSAAAHKERRDAVLENTPDEHRPWLREVLNFSNEPRLTRRLQTLAGESARVLDWDEERQESFVKMVRDTRHYLTHYDPKGAKKAAKGDRLYWLSERLLFMLSAVILMHVGVPPKTIRAGLDTNQRFKFASSRWRELDL